MSERWKRIDAVVQEALARPSAERPAFVRSACGSDGELCDEVMSLLEQETAAESFLAVPAAPAEGPSMIGRTIATYRIDARIGAGGMGVVYRARDLRLERDVAVKILPAAVADDSDALARLGREARVLASLNHPRIAAIYGLEDTGETRALVLELLDGETLAQRLARGALSVADACRLGAQIADGLAAAHDKGIVHRDLKPANVQLTSGANIKLLDFGIAKAVEGNAAGTTVATRHGAVIGTPAYMSPEQMRGETVDRQTDVWAFGCVLFEMLTGQQAFGGKTTSDVTAAVLEHEPAWSALSASVPPQIRTLARRCLMKDRSQRLRDLGDVRIALEDQPGGPADSSVMKPASPARPSRMLAWVVATAIVTAIVVGVPLWTRVGPAPLPAIRSTTMKLWLPQGAEWAGSASGVPRLTRDGRRLIAVLERDNVTSIFALELDSGSWREVAGTEQSRLAFLSADGLEVAFIRDNALLRVAINGGAPAKICDDAERIRGGDWAEDGRIVLGFAQRGLAIVPSTGGVPVAITAPDAGSSEGDHRYPIWLPGAKSILFTVQNTDTMAAGVAVTTVGSAAHRIIVRAGSAPAFIDGHLVYVNEAEELRAVAFDPVALAPGSESISLAERAGEGERTSDRAVRASATDLVYVPYYKQLYHFELINRRGDAQRLRLPPQPLKGPLTVSPNGERAVFESGNRPQDSDLWLYDITADARTQLTTDRNSRFPMWKGDDRILFQRRGGPSRLLASMLALKLDVSGHPQGPPQPLGQLQGMPMFADGDDLVYGSPNDFNSDLHRARIDGNGRGQRLLELPRNQWGAALSADRKWLAYISDELGEGFDLFISPYATPIRPRRVVTGAQWIRWSRGSNELFFVHDRTLFAATVDSSGALGPRRAVVTPIDPVNPGLPRYDSLPGDRLLVAIAEPPPEHVRAPIIVLNWAARLREAVARK